MNVALVTHYIPYYRHSILKEISSINNLNLELYADHNNTLFGHFKFINQDDFRFFNSNVKTFIVFKKIFYYQFRIIKLILGTKHDIVILTATKSDLTVWIGLILGKIVNKKIILWGHFKSNHFVEKIVNYFFLTVSHSNIFYSYNEKKLYPDFINTKSFVAVNTMAVCSSLQFNKNLINNTIIFSGRFTKGKKIDILLKALSIVKLNFDFKLYLIGDGPEREKIVSLSNDLDLNKYLEFKGLVYDPNILKSLYEDCLFAVIPSHAGLGIHQAFGNGRIIITDNDLNEQPPEFDMVNNNINGFIYEASNHKELAKYISFCFENKEEILRMGLRAKRDFDSNFSIDKMVSGFVKALHY